MARATSAASQGANSPRLTPLTMSARTACSYLSRFSMMARRNSSGQHVDFEVRGRALEFFQRVMQMGADDRAQLFGDREGRGTRRLRRRQHAVDGAVLAEEQQFVLAGEIVIQIARRQVGFLRDVAHAGGGDAAAAEYPRRRAQDVQPPRLAFAPHALRGGLVRTGIQNLNHGSNLIPGGRRTQPGPASAGKPQIPQFVHLDWCHYTVPAHLLRLPGE